MNHLLNIDHLSGVVHFIVKDHFLNNLGRVDCWQCLY